ncbi:hypothetical protein ACTJJ7_15665 [Phyllobacterium sp. 22229]|uniref:hypothetical protein n=1 Tax=Phyllobacterium sp. 22229 TaxID=3453895 RepID=UPI003F851EED
MIDPGPAKYTAKSSFQSSSGMEIAKDALDHDLGHFGNESLRNYPFDDNTKNRLIAHIRLDAAQAAINSKRIANDLRLIKVLALLLFAFEAVNFFYPLR